MTLKATERLLQLLKAYGVTHFKSLDVEIQMDLGHAPAADGAKIVPRGMTKAPITAASAPPVEMEIPHHVNEVAKLLKLSDEDLVDRLFPDYSKPQEEI